MQIKLKKYAQLIVKKGINIQKGQILVIDAAIEAATLVREVTKQAYECGAGEVVVRYYDEVVSRLKYENADNKYFEEVPQWLSNFKNDYANEGAAFLFIDSEDPEAYKGVDPKKVATWSKHTGKAMKAYRDRLDKGMNAWCVVGASSEAWATKVFPDMSQEEAVEALWNAIYKTAKVDTKDPLLAWELHHTNFEKRIKILNEMNIETLHFTNSKGTDIKVGMTDDYLFAGGAAKLQNGVYHFPNIPTEEIFSSPHKDKTNGTVYSAIPLNYNGNIIDDFYMTFENGRIIDYGASVGYDILKEMIELDNGSHYLGEVALVPYDSPISNMNTLFLNTLYDENAVCHFAIGKGFAECIKDGLTMSDEELVAKGINDSLLHVDFMIGTSDLSVVATTVDKKEVIIFKDGNFVF